jgi:threonyl-tRNA synthetase
MQEIQELRQNLNLWDFFPDAGKHLPYWQPNGAFIRSAIEDLWKFEHFRHGYDLVYTPHIARSNVWKISGHIDRFIEKMYPSIKISSDKGIEEYLLRPMNCPFHILLFKSKTRSYKEMPVRFAELGTVYRKIPSGSFKEMFEVRGFTQDDAHIFIVSDKMKIKEEIANILQFTIYFLKDIFKIDDYRIIRRLRPKEAIGSDVLWELAQNILQEVLEEKNLRYENHPAEGIFYGPKIDFEIADAHYKKNWICSTIQLDVALAAKFNIKYITKDNKSETPLIIHRTILGSLERFIAILVSRTKGHLPLWLSHSQMLIIPVDGSEYQINFEYANSVKTILSDKLNEFKPRIKISTGQQSVSDAKKYAIAEKIPFIVVVGGRERMNRLITVTWWTGNEYSKPKEMEIETLSEQFKTKIKTRT